MIFKGMGPREVMENSRGPVMNLSAFSRHRSLEDSALFGDIRGRANLEHESEINVTFENYRRHIPLKWPVLNYIVSNNGRMLKDLLGLKKRDFDNLISFKAVLDITHLIPVIIRDFKDKEVNEVLMGPEALLELSKSVRIDFLILAELKKLNTSIMSALGHRTSINTKFTYFQCKDKEDLKNYSKPLHVIADYYVTATPLVYEYGLTQEIVSQVVQERIGDGFTSLTYLINIGTQERYEEVIKQMFITEVMVMPEGLRPTMDKMVHQFTNQYKKVLKEVDYIQQHTEEMTVEEKRTAYLRLDRAVHALVYKDKAQNKDKTDPSVSIVSTLKSKKGFIRGKMLGKRTDYSGRSVITINPELSLDEAAIPKEMIVKLYRPHHAKAVQGLKSYSDILKMDVDEALSEIINLGLLENIPVMLNRAPSLHRLSLLGFKTKISRSDSIELSPLVTTGFNADFDGDQMGVHMPISEKSIAEVNKLMLPSKNIYHPATGNSIIQPKMEMIYGLNVATKEYPDKQKNSYSYSSLEEVYSAITNHDIKVWDTVTVPGFGALQAGRAGLLNQLPKEMHDIEDVITNKTISKYTQALIDRFNSDSEIFVRVTDNLVSYGFKMSKLYSPTISVLDESYASTDLRSAIHEFYENVKDITLLYNRGLEDALTYEETYANLLKEAGDKVIAQIPEVLGEDNGFLQLVRAGARGSIDNLRQIYAYKGQIQRSDYEQFSAVIESNFSEQLNPLEHFISAYGTRKGLIDKTQKTGDTGYSERLMYQAAADWVITNDDCHTDEGLDIDKNFISNFIKNDKIEEKNEEISKFFKSIIKGRFLLGSDEILDDTEAHRLAYDTNITHVTIRSPLTCKKPCCVKCYGTDLATNKVIVKGQPIGFIAGHSIGEPGTQLTMRTFQKGGVAGKSDVTSNFDRMNRYLTISSMQSVPTYDPVAWASGEVIETPINDFTKLIQIKGSSLSVTVPIDAYLKEEAVKGEGLSQLPGEHDIRELIKYAGFRKAQMYLHLAMATCYLGVADINSIHFEVLVASMSVHTLLDAAGTDLKPGLLYTTHRISEYANTDIKYLSTIKSVKVLPLLKDSPLNRILMENFVKGTSSSVVLGLEDRLDNQMVRLMMGMRPKLGTAYPNYLEEGRG